jgi:hypothetical protein
MPAGSDGSGGELVLPHTWRPIGVRIAGFTAGSLLLLLALVAWFALPGEVRDDFSMFQRITMVVLTSGAYVAGWAILRSRVTAEDTRVIVVNGYKRREFEYAEIIAVHLPPGAPWVVLDLADGTSVSALGIQASDGARAHQAVRQLRALIS